MKIVESKICYKCKQIKSIMEFYKNKDHKDGLQNICKECDKAESKKYREANPGKNNLTVKNWRKNHPEYQKEWREKNPEYVKQWNPERRKEIGRKSATKRLSTIQGRINDRMSTALYHALRENKNGRRWELLVNYTLVDLKKHLEKQFTEDMTWDLFMKGKIHIDHKIPKSVFNYTSPKHIDFKKCWTLDNLQPMWAIENYKKHAKLKKPFQPSLAIGD